ncbi:MAG: DUF4328 domain-containing protein [Verrucomicrobiota bacterium]
MSDWYYAKEKQKCGPVTGVELRDLLVQGILARDSLVWTEGMDDWQPVFKVSELLESVPETASCAVSGKRMPVSQMLAYGEQKIDPAQKQNFVQHLREGGTATGAFPISSEGYVYVDPTARANITKWLLVGGTLLSIAMAVSGFFTTGMESEDFNIADGIQALLLLGYIPIWIAGIVFFCMWKHRACSNAYALGGMEGVNNPITPGWAVGYYFIPILMLWKPYQAMKQIWEASSGGGRSLSVIGLWWALWILTGVLDRFSFKLAFSGQEGTGLILDGVTAVIAIPLLLFLLKIIGEITKAQVATQKERSDLGGF